MFFFVETPITCLTAASRRAGPPYPATIKTVGKTLVKDTPIPNYVSFPTGLEGSLTSLTLNWKNLSTKL